MTPPSTKSKTSAGLRVDLQSSRRPFARACPPVPLALGPSQLYSTLFCVFQARIRTNSCEPIRTLCRTPVLDAACQGDGPAWFPTRQNATHAGGRTRGDELAVTWPQLAARGARAARNSQGARLSLTNGAHRCQSSGSSSTIGYETAALPSSLFSPTVFAQSSVHDRRVPFCGSSRTLPTVFKWIAPTSDPHRQSEVLVLGPA